MGQRRRGHHIGRAGPDAGGDGHRLAAAAALLSSLAGNAVPSRSVFFGEIALSGAVRAAPRMDQRLKEAARLGFQRAYGPDSSPAAEGALTVTPIARLIALVDLLAPDAANA